ncbi:MAG: hypothetical protein WA814_13595 [Candidatus Baltobacteraceae bacterium]
MLVSGAFLAACAQHGAMLPSTSLAPPLAGTPQGVTALPDLTPPNCKGQKSTKQYASLTVKLSSKGGSFCIPAFGGFGGTVEYPPANPAVKLKLISSTTNYNHQPELGPGKALFYLQLALSDGTSFGSNVQAGGGLTGKKIVSGKPYTAYGQATIDSFPFDFGPCYTVATKGRYGGVIGGVGTLLKGQNIPVAAKGVIEIYAGKQTGTQC